MPYNVPPEQWTPEYAAQIMRLMEEGYAQNPNIPQDPAPSGIVPMGDPGSLTPPRPPMTPQTGMSRPSFAGPAPAPAPRAPAPQAPLPAQGARPSPGPAAGTGWHDKLQQILPMIAAMAYGQDPQNRHMASLALHMGQIQQQQRGQEQLSKIQANLARITQEKGIDAAKKYLTEVASSPQASPEVSKVVTERLREVSQQVNARDAVAKLSSGDPKKVIESLPAIYETLPTDVATSLVKAFKQDDKVQFLQVGDQVLAGDRSTAEVKEVFKADPRFKISEIGGDNVTEELIRMGYDPVDIGTRAKEGDEEARGVLQQATETLKQEREKAREKAQRTALTAAEMQAKATMSGMIKSAQISAEAGAKMNIPVEMVDKDAVVYDLEKAGRATPFTNTPEQIIASQGKKTVLSQQDYQKVGRADAVLANLDEMEKAAMELLADEPGQNLFVAARDKLQPALADEKIAKFQAWEGSMLSLAGMIQGDNRISDMDAKSIAGFRPSAFDTKKTAQERIRAARGAIRRIRAGVLGGSPANEPLPGTPNPPTTAPPTTKKRQGQSYGPTVSPKGRVVR